MTKALAGLRREIAQHVGDAIEIGLVGVADRVVRCEQFDLLHAVDRDVLAGQAIETGRSGRPAVRDEVEPRGQRVVECPRSIGQGPLLQAAVAERAVGRGVLRRAAVGHIKRVGIGEEVVLRAEIHRLVFADEAALTLLAFAAVTVILPVPPELPKPGSIAGPLPPLATLVGNAPCAPSVPM